MASRRRKQPARRKPAKGRSRSRARSSYLMRPRLPVLDQNEKDVLGLGLVAGAVFFAFVFYLGWDGGEVGEAFADGFVWLFGGVGYLVPIALFAAGAVLVVGPMLPTVRPFKAGGLMLLTALMLGLAAGTLRPGPRRPAARRGVRDAELVPPPRRGGRRGALLGRAHPVPGDRRAHPVRLHVRRRLHAADRRVDRRPDPGDVGERASRPRGASSAPRRSSRGSSRSPSAPSRRSPRTPSRSCAPRTSRRRRSRRSGTTRSPRWSRARSSTPRTARRTTSSSSTRRRPRPRTPRS